MALCIELVSHQFLQNPSPYFLTRLTYNLQYLLWVGAIETGYLALSAMSYLILPTFGYSSPYYL